MTGSPHDRGDHGADGVMIGTVEALEAPLALLRCQGIVPRHDGTVVPGNYPLAPEERERRLERFYRPYHDAVGAMIASVVRASGHAPFIFSVHSFTPVMQCITRPWHAGIRRDRDG